MSNMKQQLTQLIDSATSITEKLQHEKLGGSDIAAIRSSMNSVLPIAERHERLLRTMDVEGVNSLAMDLEVCAVGLWNAVSLAIKSETEDMARKVLCSVKFFACLLCSIHESLAPSLKDKFRTLNCAYRALRTAVDQDDLPTAGKIQEHADRAFKALETLSPGFEKEVFKEFHRVKTELFITKMQLSILEGDIQMAKFYEERAEVSSTEPSDSDSDLTALETVRVIYNSSLMLFNKSKFEDVIHFLKKAVSFMSHIKNTTESTKVKEYVLSLLARSCLEVKSPECLEVAAEAIQNMESITTTTSVEPFKLGVELAKIQGSTVEIESIIMRMIMTVPITENFKDVLGIINDYATISPSSAIKCYEYAFTNKLDPSSDHDALEMLFVAMVNAFIKDKVTLVDFKCRDLTEFFNNAERIFVKAISKKCSSSSITLLWTAGKSSMKNDEFTDAISWLKLGLHRVLEINDIDKAKFQRCLQSCYINIEEYDHAVQIYHTMSEEGKNTLVTQYNMFKVYAAKDDEEQLMNCLKKIVSYDEKNLIPLLALCSMKCQPNTRVAVEAMVQLFKKIDVGFNSEISVLSALKSVCQLILRQSDSAFKDQYRDTLLNLFQETLGLIERMPKVATHDELKWFSAQCFNIARECLISKDYFNGNLFAECSMSLNSLIRDDVSTSESMTLKLWKFRAGMISLMCQSKIPNIDPAVLWSNVRVKSLDLRLTIDELMAQIQTNPELMQWRSEWEKCFLDCMVFQFKADLELSNQSAVEQLVDDTQRFTTVEFDSTLVNMILDTSCSTRLRSAVISKIIERNIANIGVPSTTISRWVRLLLKQPDNDIIVQKVLAQIESRLGTQHDDNKFPAHEVEWMSTECWNRGVGYMFEGSTGQGTVWCTHAMKLSKFVNERLEHTLQQMWTELSATHTA